ncbi:hypothetical protein VF04_04335 [Nostoc linckia z7]|uniref:Uncharacterized protein n=2 Tax=Nostoc linckia TaxID=92942 RepID=A0A9Q5ZGH9_NOSLI|nr:hypothetical protein [Nostoc linckia]PHK42940.1 hypothetical protein VF12_01035 [Nostoc linckia z15]PHK48097.1 hypothetical protein VF13_02010 [Nostoc linckia z16]PHJ65017.1 hypothetical protein VF02_11820 [Nostoc linckia z1]PHJ70195.1 hypothetical protein VF05_11980 [Nostoc linckia z3]PHJ75096.1 hypothetical protein VF03_12140 [Nostoc linckia z2]
MNYSLFDVLDIINFESGNIKYHQIKNQQFKNEIWESSKLIKLWWFMWRLSPKADMVEFIFSKLFGEHISIGNLTIFGCNAMMFAFQLRTKKGIWLFQPPCFNLYHHKFTWGILYLSPNGTSRHPMAKIYYGRKRSP